MSQITLPYPLARNLASNDTRDSSSTSGSTGGAPLPNTPFVMLNGQAPSAARHAAEPTTDLAGYATPAHQELITMVPRLPRNGRRPVPKGNGTGLNAYVTRPTVTLGNHLRATSGFTFLPGPPQALGATPTVRCGLFNQATDTNAVDSTWPSALSR